MKQFKLTIGDPTLVAASEPNEERWGYFQFPRIWVEPDGRLVVSIPVRPDDDRSLDQRDTQFESCDGGSTWTPAQGYLREPYVTLPNGDQLHREAAMFRTAEVTLPRPVGVYNHNSGRKYPLYRWPDIDPQLGADCFRVFRRQKGSADWRRQHTEIDDPHVLCTSIDTGVFVPFGDPCCEFHSAADGSLIYLGYRVRLKENGRPGRYTGPWLLRSTDGGVWRYHSSIEYQPDTGADPKAHDRLGFTEPTMLLLERERSICVMRTTDRLGQGPLYQATSEDTGCTWSKPSVIAGDGARPRLLRLDNEAIVLSAGRPGVQIHVSVDNGKTWSEPRKLLASDSCGYTYLVPVGADQFMIVYSHFRYQDGQGHRRKAIMAREITVTL